MVSIIFIQLLFSFNIVPTFSWYVYFSTRLRWYISFDNVCLWVIWINLKSYINLFDWRLCSQVGYQVSGFFFRKKMAKPINILNFVLFSHGLQSKPGFVWPLCRYWCVYIYIFFFVYLVRKLLPNSLLVPEFSSDLNADFFYTFLETLWFQGVLI